MSFAIDLSKINLTESSIGLKKIVKYLHILLIYFLFLIMDLNNFKETFDKLLLEYVEKKILDCKKLLDHVKLNQIIDYIKIFMFS
jgi:hypothetical protein